MKTRNFEIEAFGETLFVEANIWPGESSDYMYPGSPTEIEIIKVETEAGDVTNLVLEYIEDSVNTIKDEIQKFI